MIASKESRSVYLCITKFIASIVVVVVVVVDDVVVAVAVIIIIINWTIYIALKYLKAMTCHDMKVQTDMSSV